MDRTMYGKFTPGECQPYRCTLRLGSESPGYALLADLQNTISPGGYGSLNGPRSGGSGPLHSPTYQTRRVETTITTSSAPSKGSGGPLNNNLSELDSLLQDLSSARYSRTERREVHSVTNGTIGLDQPRRPTVDSLLDELSTSVHNGETTETRSYSVGATPGASSATKELDDLMASLSDFKINPNTGAAQHQTVTDSPYAKPNKATRHSPATGKPNQLDCMLGNLQADMSRQGVSTTQKGCCHACDKPIVGQVITALGKTWHPEHFTCTHCNQELGTRNFFERDSHPYCEPDYHNLFSPRCAYCNGPILDKCVTALEKTWHTEHFFCAQCGKQFGEEGFHERDGKPYCRDDYFDMFAPKCGGCGRPIMENYISALNSQWHADCFVCRDCKIAVKGKSFYAMEGKPVCPKCVGLDEEEGED